MLTVWWLFIDRNIRWKWLQSGKISYLWLCWSSLESVVWISLLPLPMPVFLQVVLSRTNLSYPIPIQSLQFPFGLSYLWISFIKSLKLIWLPKTYLNNWICDVAPLNEASSLNTWLSCCSMVLWRKISKTKTCFKKTLQRISVVTQIAGAEVADNESRIQIHFIGQMRQRTAESGGGYAYWRQKLSTCWRRTELISPIQEKQLCGQGQENRFFCTKQSSDKKQSCKKTSFIPGYTRPVHTKYKVQHIIFLLQCILSPLYVCCCLSLSATQETIQQKWVSKW